MMLKTEKSNSISGYQLSLLLMGYLFGDAAIGSPEISAGGDAWLAFSLGWFGGFFLLWMYSKISSNHPGKCFQEILEESLGKKIGIFVGILYVGFFIHLCAVVLRFFGEYMTVTIYYETPVFFTISVFALVVAYSVKKGLRILGRTAEMLMPYLFIFVFLLFIMLWEEYDLKTMLPILDNGFRPVAKAAFGVFTFPFGEAVAFLYIFSAYEKPKEMTKITLLSVLIMGLILLSITFRDLWSLGPDMMTRFTFPPSVSTELTFNMTLDPIIAVNLLIGGWVKISICLYAAVAGITQILRLEDYKPFVLPMTTIVIALSMIIYRNVFQMLTWWQSISYAVMAVFFQMFIPLSILIITLFKNKKNKRRKINQGK